MRAVKLRSRIQFIIAISRPRRGVACAPEVCAIQERSVSFRFRTMFRGTFDGGVTSTGIWLPRDYLNEEFLLRFISIALTSINRTLSLVQSETRVY